MSELRKGLLLAGRYTLQRELGGGGESRTWLAADKMTGASVAVKLATADAAATERLRAEWQTSIRLMHAHIARVFEFHDENLPAFYSRQYIDGPDIGALAGAAPEHILNPIALVAGALQYAHSRNVVHRDVKAANVLLDRNGAPYLIDFGVAQSAGESASGGSLISASPQQLDGEPAQPADDVFALGGLVYELVAGRSPYSSETTEADIRSQVPPPLKAADGSAIPDAVLSLIARMLDKHAANRPTADDVVSELAAAGFAGSAAPKDRLGAAPRARDEVIEASASISPQRKSPHELPQATPTVAGDGLSRKTVGISLAVLVGLLLAVVFLLPKMSIERERPVADDGADVAAPADALPDAKPADDDAVPFNENINRYESRDERLQARNDAETVLGILLSHVDTLEQRAVERWGGRRFAEAKAEYEAGDALYLEKDYARAADRYRAAITIVEPLLGEVDGVFRQTMTDAKAAFDAGNTIEAVQLFELAVAITPNDAEAIAGYERARNLDTVLSLVNQGVAYEKDLELDAALQSFERAVEIDPAWLPAAEGVQRVRDTMTQMEFDQRMTEGLLALEQGDYATARAAFTMARKLKPESPEPADGLLQVDLGMKLGGIASLEQQAYAEENGERWQAAAETYEKILGIDANLSFAQQGLSRSRQMSALHEQLSDYIDNPDVLSRPSTMQKATRLVVDITRMPDIGPRLSEQRDELSRLLKRAATPLRVQLVSDNVTDVSIYKIGKLGSFSTQELTLRPGTYVAVGSRPGYRDVRLEFRVAPEIDMQPIVVRCEEAI